MTVVHLEVLVEEPSAEAALEILIPRIVPRVGFDVRPYQGRPDLLRKLPGVPRSLGARPRFRNPDAVVGGTWEAMEQVLQEHGHHRAGLRKIAAAGAVATHMDVENNRSASFNAFRDGVRRLVGGEN